MKYIFSFLITSGLIASTSSQSFAKNISCTNLGLNTTSMVLISDETITEYNFDGRIVISELTQSEIMYSTYELRTPQNEFLATITILQASNSAHMTLRSSSDVVEYPITNCVDLEEPTRD